MCISWTRTATGKRCSFPSLAVCTFSPPQLSTVHVKREQTTRTLKQFKFFSQKHQLINIVAIPLGNEWTSSSTLISFLFLLDTYRTQLGLCKSYLKSINLHCKICKKERQTCCISTARQDKRFNKTRAISKGKRSGTVSDSRGWSCLLRLRFKLYHNCRVSHRPFRQWLKVTVWRQLESLDKIHRNVFAGASSRGFWHLWIFRGVGNYQIVLGNCFYFHFWRADPLWNCNGNSRAPIISYCQQSSLVHGPLSVASISVLSSDHNFTVLQGWGQRQDVNVCWHLNDFVESICSFEGSKRFFTNDAYPVSPDDHFDIFRSKITNVHFCSVIHIVVLLQRAARAACTIYPRTIFRYVIQ